MSDPTRLTESAPRAVDAFLRRLDNWKFATALIKDDPASALRTIETLKSERNDLLTLVRDIVAERSGKPKSCGHDFDCNCTDFAATSLIARLDGPVTP